MIQKARLEQQAFNFMDEATADKKELAAPSQSPSRICAREITNRLSAIPQEPIPYKIGVQNKLGEKLSLDIDHRDDDLYLVDVILRALNLKGLSIRKDTAVKRLGKTILSNAFPEIECAQDAKEKLKQILSIVDTSAVDYNLDNMLAPADDFSPSRKDGLNAALSVGFFFEHSFKKHNITTEQRLNFFVNYINSLIAFVKNIDQYPVRSDKPKKAFITPTLDLRSLQLPRGDR